MIGSIIALKIIDNILYKIHTQGVMMKQIILLSAFVAQSIFAMDLPEKKMPNLEQQAVNLIIIEALKKGDFDDLEAASALLNDHRFAPGSTVIKFMHNLRNERDYTRNLLQIAVKKGYPRMAAFLVENNLITPRDALFAVLTDYQTPIAPENAVRGVVKALIDAGADPKKDEFIATYSLVRAIDANKQETALLLLERGAHPNPQLEGKPSPLKLAEEKNFTQLAQKLREAGAK